MPVPLPWEANPPSLATVTKEDFDSTSGWRFGASNPDFVEFSFQKFAVQSGLTTYDIRELFGVNHFSDQDGDITSDSKTFEPLWSFNREFGTVTPYKSNFLVYIGGQDTLNWSDEFICQDYNDVIVRSVFGDSWIYGYPPESFPPLTFHSATCYPENDSGIPSTMINKMLIVGGISPPFLHEWWRTPVYLLDLNTFRIEPVSTSGEEPLGLYGHKASLLSNKRLRVFEGTIFFAEGQRRSNIEEYELDLVNFKWTKLRTEFEIVPR